jgi:hypothetical protein
MLRSPAARRLLVGALASLLSSCTPALHPQLIGPASAIVGGSTVTLKGQSWGTDNSGCAPTVGLRAFVAGISPYASLDLPSEPVSADGSFQANWRTPAVSESMKWTVDASQDCNGSIVRSSIQLDLSFQ